MYFFYVVFYMNLSSVILKTSRLCDKVFGDKVLYKEFGLTKNFVVINCKVHSPLFMRLIICILDSTV